MENVSFDVHPGEVVCNAVAPEKEDHAFEMH